MNNRAGKSCLLLILLLGVVPLLAQSHFESTTLNLISGISTYKLSGRTIINHSESVWADSLQLIAGLDYRMDYKRAELQLLRSPETAVLRVEFLLLPEFLIKTYQSWEPQIRSDSLFNSIKRRTSPIFGSDARLDIQGAKTFAITFSDNEAFDLKQSLYVNLSGELAKGVSLTAQLSDSQSKLSPEGDSKELSSLDRMFIRVNSRKFELAMGDLELKFTDTKYMEYYSKFEGLSLLYTGRHMLQGAYSAGSGKSTSSDITIIDGKQGPYYLKPNDYQPGFIVVAGSEEIFVDGSKWERGIDYSIDYAEGSIMFKRLISSSNVVLARFQYSDEYYPQSSYLNASKVRINDLLSLSHHLIWQQDDRDNPLLYTFSSSDKDSLSLAGDAEAWCEGILAVDAGSGSYKQIVTSTGTIYYEYAPNDSLANYNIVFSYVGYGRGDYEEYSAGKYRYIGLGQGSWLPRKRLIAPVKRGNLEMAINYGDMGFKAGIEALGSVNDRNTMSGQDDDDNLGGILFAFAEIPIAKLRLKLDHEQRSANTYLFGKYSDPVSEYDFGAISSADSLASQQSNLSLGFSSAKWNSSILLRYRDIYDLYALQALRISSSSQGFKILPAINVRSTVSQQDYHTISALNSLMQYHQAELSWLWRSFKLRLEGLYNFVESEQFGSSYLKLSPLLSYGNTAKSFTQIAFTSDESKLKAIIWKDTASSQTYALKHISNLKNHNISLDISHRELEQAQSETNPKSSYDLVNLRSNHNFLKQAVSLYSNYTLNQTEFYPKIRELEYIGSGLGLYDSTGVSIPNGDYDYVFITSSTGSLSAEINALFTLYLKPGNLSRGSFLKRWQSDTSLNLNEQSTISDDWKSYIFYPGTVYNEDTTIYGKQSLQQNLWLNLMTNHLTGNLQVNMDRSLDRRYQTPDRSYSLSRAAQLDIKGFNAYSTRLQYNLDNSEDSRYDSQAEVQGLSALIQRNIATLTNIQADLAYSSESGGKQDGSQAYKLSSYQISPSLRSVWMQKYRLSASFLVKRNFLSGSTYFSFLPQKREGWITGITLNGIYRMNSFSSFSIDYRFTDYPSEKSKHELKLEFKAEL